MAENQRQQLRHIKRFNNKKFKELTAKYQRRVAPSEYETTMRDPNNVLEIDNLHTYFYTDVGTVNAVSGVTIDIPQGKTVGIVGESGCGKSVTSLSILRLLQEPQGQITAGQLRFNPSSGGTKALDLVKLPPAKMDAIRGGDITMIFQEPMTTLNPVFTIGRQLDEVLKYHNINKLSSRQVAARSVEMLETVGIANARGVYKMYPHELSGGMRQRVVIAMALMCGPKLIIADEPTTALDVTIQAQILDLMRLLKEKISASIMLITHDLGVVAEIADFVAVMYAGRIVEQGTTRDIFHNPAHPYTIGLMKSRPSNVDGERLYAIPGNLPNPIGLPDYCFFRGRCNSAVRACETGAVCGTDSICGTNAVCGTSAGGSAGAYPPMFALSDTHKSACWRHIGEGAAL
ncbi:MAG: ABC transporter ATP-binding protein [Clostridiales bacterium]|nr:ABC transporter ATP-binding protein [Clostridiales bacterium]